jgi:hypothetical protein
LPTVHSQIHNASIAQFRLLFIKARAVFEWLAHDAKLAL